MNTDMNDGGAGATAENYFAAEGVSGNMLSFGQLEQATQGRNWLQGWNVSSVGRLRDGGIVDEVEERRASLEVAQQVWVFDEDEEARKAVRGHDRWSLYAAPQTRMTDDLLPHYGRDYAEVAMPGKKDDPWACVEALIGAAPEERAKVYREAFEELKVSGRDRADDYWALCGRIVRDETRAKLAEHKAREREVQGSLKKLDRYIAGEAFGTGEGALSEGDVANAALVLDSKKMEDAKAVRAFMQTYVKPLEGLDDAGDILGAVRELEDEFFECIGEDEQRAAMAYIALMGFAERIKNSNMVDAGDEFVVTMGNTLQNWGHVAELVEPLVAAAPVGHPDFPIELPVETREGLYNEARARAANYDRRNNARAILRRAINTALELSKTEGFWKGSLRAAAQMTGQTLPYLVPYVGMYLGTADVLVRGGTETRDSYLLGQVADDGYYFNRLGGNAASNQAAVETGIQAAVELIPFGRVGGKGLSAVLRGRVAKGAVGGVTRWAVRVTQSGVGRALAAEIGANFVEEAVLEPIAAGIAQYGIEGLMDAMGVEHAPSKEFTECFAELSHIWNDPRQLAGMAMFSAALGTAGLKGIRANVKHFKDSRVMWEAQGLKPSDVDIVMEAAPAERFEVGKRLLDEAREKDPAGLKRRMIDANKAIKDRGGMLVWAGVGGDAEMQEAYAATWNEYVKQGLLPEVRAEDGGQYRIVDKGKGVDMVVPEAQADAYLAGALAQAETVLTAEARLAEERLRGVKLRAVMVRRWRAWLVMLCCVRLRLRVG